MKRLLYIFSILFFSITAHTQSEFGSASCDHSINSITIRDDGEYAIAYDYSDAQWTNDMPQKMEDKIWELNKAKKKIKQIESQSDGSYVILWDKNDAQWTNDIPEKLSDKILELNKNGNTIKNVALRDDDAFVILWDKNQAMWTNDVPQKLIDKILELNKNGDEIKQVVLREDGGYVILWNRNQAQWTTDIPTKLSDKILELNKNGNEINHVALMDDGNYVIVWDKNQVQYSGGIPSEMKKKLGVLSCNDGKEDIQIAKPVIVWNSPSRSSITVENRLQNLDACISSDGDVREVQLFVNGQFMEASRDFVIKKVNSCKYPFQKSVYLNTGRNTVQLVAYNQAGSTYSQEYVINVQEKSVVNNDPKPAKANDRVALIIGNANYQDVNAVLKNPRNDANAMATKLEGLGFKVIKVVDATQSEMKAKIREFGNELENNKIGLFYYAGHGFQIDGTNYLVPIDAQVEDKADAEDACVSINYLLNKMELSNSETNLVILDACRNNPFRSWSRSSNNGGLSSLDKQPTGSLIAFATQPGNVAADGVGSNGLYTSAWLKHLESGKNIYEVLTNINNSVANGSSDKQVPWFNSSLKGIFVF